MKNLLYILLAVFQIANIRASQEYTAELPPEFTDKLFHRGFSSYFSIKGTVDGSDVFISELTQRELPRRVPAPNLVNLVVYGHSSIGSIPVHIHLSDKWTKTCKLRFNESYDISLTLKDIAAPQNCDYLLAYSPALTYVKFDNFDTSNVESMQGMLAGCSRLSSIDVSSLNTSKVQNMSFMFERCEKVRDIKLKGIDTSNVTDMAYLCSDCFELRSIDVNELNTCKVKNMNGMFSYCFSMTYLNLSALNTDELKFAYKMFEQCSNLQSLIVSPTFCRNIDIYVDVPMYNLDDDLSTITWEKVFIDMFNELITVYKTTKVYSTEAGVFSDKFKAVVDMYKMFDQASPYALLSDDLAPGN